MLYLRTGANGSCKTLFSLEDVRKLQLETKRPVAINARFKIYPHKLEEFGWKVIEFKDWEDEPDGTIFLMDEVHNDLPLRPNSAPVPRHVSQLAEHRSRGFDFFLLTQHPMNIDAFVRKLIGAPGWHQHLKRRFGASNTTTVIQWEAVNTNCEKDGSGKNAQSWGRKQPKHVYDWYESAEMHTGKVRIPKQVYTLVACLIGMIACIVFAYMRFTAGQKPPEKPAQAPTTQQVAGASGTSAAPAQSPENHVLTAVEYAATFQPRIEGLAYTAPRYDGMTKPVSVPYPAACIQMGKRCECYTQQATPLQVPASLCTQIVKGGFFNDWQQALQQAAAGQAPQATPQPIQTQQPESINFRTPTS